MTERRCKVLTEDEARPGEVAPRKVGNWRKRAIHVTGLSDRFPS
jgi:hypothetical protein